MTRHLIVGAAALVAAPYLLLQVRRPTRYVGRFFAWAMNRSHSALTDWGLGHVAIEPGIRALDVGCGGGRTVGKLATRASAGFVAGIDFAPGSVAVARATNRRAIEAGRVRIEQASVSTLPFPDATFDLVTAVETHYYWPNPPADLREVLRVLKPGGTALVVAEAYRRGATGALEERAMQLLGASLMTAEGHRTWFEAAGFRDVQVDENGRGWICVRGTRPA